ncbi:MAG: hypothetical protein O8C66_08875 [Candidatus Methanoperedens sp.]|nr:hypothetical protein [Candidatus Methanoperedens sp.]MCZ7370609.1 hypothetical protein [Candidatus Methanoperedens sp.]
MIKKLFVTIGCDTDPLIEVNQRAIFNKESAWDDVIQSVIRLKEEIKTFEDEQKKPPKIIWYLRSDHQINIIWGDWCYPVREYVSLWNEFEKSGDEIGWHPHLWKLNEIKNIWYQEIKDKNWISHCLEKGYKEISKIFRVKSTRMGWDFHNNYTMNILNSLGILNDLSAIPGIKNNGTIDNIYDWKNTSRYPYFPSKHDYKIEDSDPSNNHKIVEIPITTYPIPFYLRVLTRKGIIAANIAKHPLFFKNAIKIVVNRNEEEAFLSTYFHPSDIKDEKGLFSLNNFKRNLNNIVEIARKKKLEVLFITPQELGERYDTVA